MSQRLLTAAMLAFAAVRPGTADTFTIKLDAEATARPVTGRVVLYFIVGDHPRLQHADPIEGPFYHAPQPIASVAVRDLQPGGTVTIDNAVFCANGPLDALQGKARVQAILDIDQSESPARQAAGNVKSAVKTIELSVDRNDQVDLTLDVTIKAPQRPVDEQHVKWVEFRSEKLSAFHGREVVHRAGVALPPGFDESSGERSWPAIYVVPGFGGGTGMAAEWALTLHHPGVADVAPMGVYIVLDPAGPFGHHGFCDSANNGPRGEALITEFIPWLEDRFHLAARPEARLLTGHSSGAWSALWLQLVYPETFGGCWATAPDPIDFTAFQMTNLYDDANLFEDQAGKPTSSFCSWTSPSEQSTLMTVRQEAHMEHAIDPEGRSGQQWDAWEAMFSPRNPETGLPMPMFDALTGEIHRSVLRHWARFDLTRIASRNWNRFGPTILNKVHVACGGADSFHLNRAVAQFAEMVKRLKADASGPGYVLIVPNADHGEIIGKMQFRFNQEMREHLISQGLQDTSATTRPLP